MADDTASIPSKKRKANDGRATLADGGGGFFSSLFGYYFSGSRVSHDTSSSADQHGNNHNDQFMQQSLSHMERMEQSMQRMEEKLSTLSSVERRCELLEAKCSSLETKFDTTSQSVEEIDTKLTNLHSDLRNNRSSLETHLVEKNYMLELKLNSALELLKQNKNWTYPVAIHSYDWLDDEDEAAFLVRTATAIKEKTIKMRIGEFPDLDEDDGRAIVLVDQNDEEYSADKLLPHWEQFATALKLFSPTIIGYNGCFEFGNFRLGGPILELIKAALIGKTFVKMSFSHNLQVDYEEGD